MNVLDLINYHAAGRAKAFAAEVRRRLVARRRQNAFDRCWFGGAS